MNRRQFVATLVVAPTVGTITPVSGEQFYVSGFFDHAGEDPALAYFSLGQTISISIDPQKAPRMVELANALVGKQVRIELSEV